MGQLVCKGAAILNKHYTSREIFGILENEIISLKIAPGAALSEHSLCERFGVSRSPIRSVLQELRLCGLVNITPYKATHVTRMDFDIIHQIIYQRIAVESFVLEDFIRLSDLLEMERIRHIHSQMLQLMQAGSFAPEAFYALDSQLHGVWFHATRKTYLWDSIQKSDCHYTRFRMLDIVETQHFDQIVAEHEELLRIIGQKDTGAVRPAMQKHLSGGITRLGQRIFTDLKDYFAQS